MLVSTIDNSYQLRQLFKEFDRENSFSSLGYDKLYDYLDSNFGDDGDGGDFKVDVIALCGDFSEANSAEECLQTVDYSEYKNQKIEFINNTLTENEIEEEEELGEDERIEKHEGLFENSDGWEEHCKDFITEKGYEAIIESYNGPKNENYYLINNTII